MLATAVEHPPTRNVLQTALGDTVQPKGREKKVRTSFGAIPVKSGTATQSMTPSLSLATLLSPHPSEGMTTGRLGLRADTFLSLRGAAASAAAAPAPPGLADLKLILSSALYMEAESETSSAASIASPKNASHLYQSQMSVSAPWHGHNVGTQRIAVDGV